jgi:hypothetical protein
LSTDRFIKLSVGYYRDPKIAGLDDAGEVMFTRALAYSGDARTGGHVPDSIVTSLSRKPVTARRTAERIAASGAWTRTTDGWLITRWSEWQDALDQLEQKRRRDRDRKRQSRAGVRGQSADSHADVRTTEQEEELDAAAAAPGDGSKPVLDQCPLPPTVEILRSKMQAHTALAALRWDGLDGPQLIDIEDLIEDHGDARLVAVALSTCRNPPPVFVQAFIGTWKSLPEPGHRLRLVAGYCDTHHQEEPCGGCAADARVAESDR